MAFDDLPHDWVDRPLTDPRLVADVLDLLLPDADRRAGTLLAVLCDEQARYLMATLVADLGRPSEEERVFGLAGIVRAAARVEASLLFAVARTEGLSVTADDTCWARAAQRACAGRARLLGFHLVTCDGSRLIPVGEEAA